MEPFRVSSLAEMPGNMHILCLEQFSNLGGGQLALIGLLPALRARGCQVRVALPAEGPLAAKIRELGCAVDILPFGFYPNGHKTFHDAVRYARETPKLCRAIEQSVAEHRIDLLYVNAPRPLPAAAIAARRQSVPLVFHSHNRIGQPAAACIAGCALRFAHARVIACSHFAAEPLRAHIRPDALSVLYNGIAPIASGPRPARKLRRIGVIGRIETEKGQLDFVRAAWLLVRQFPDCLFTVVGAPSFSDNRYFEKVIRASRGLPIFFTGWRNDIAAVFENLDLLAVPSSPLEAAARVIVEAFAARVPVVAFPSGGIPEIIEDGVTGFLTRASTPEALARRMADVLTMDCSRLRSVVNRAYKSWHATYTLDSYQQQVTDLLVGQVANLQTDWQSAYLKA